MGQVPEIKRSVCLKTAIVVLNILQYLFVWLSVFFLVLVLILPILVGTSEPLNKGLNYVTLNSDIHSVYTVHRVCCPLFCFD